MTKSSRLHLYSFFHILADVNAAAILFAAALLTATIFAVPAFAEELNGENKEITAAGPWDVSYTNSNTEQLSTITIGSLNNGTRYTYSGALTGNIAVDITHGAATNNENRFTFSSTGNNFTGGVTMHGGILFITAGNLPTNYSLTLDKSVLMSSADSTYSGSLTIPEGSFAGLRSSGNITYSGVISGSGDLLITTESEKKVTLSGVNTYTGVTSIGTHQGGSTSNSKAYLVLGADNTLPFATVVEIARSQNPTYNYTKSTVANLDLNGTTQTIAGLYGGGVASITNGKDAAANLTIDVADSKSYEYSGTIAGYSAAKPTNLTITGAGNQTLAGNVTNASITKNGTGALTLSGGTVTLSSLAVTEGSFALDSNTAMTVRGKLSLNSSTLDLNGSNLTYTSNLASDFNNVNITNTTSETQSVLTIAPTAELSNQTYNKTISGNTRLVVKLYSNQNNNSRLILSGTNTFTGGLYIEQGTVQVSSTVSLGTNKQIDFKHASLMTSQSLEGYTINLVGDASKGERGAIRLSGGDGSFKAKITGVGSLEIVNDGAVTLTNTENDYQGKTYIGNFQWRSNGLSSAATLNLGASGVLPDKTEVVFGKSADGNGTSGAITLDLKGFNETVAGISGQSTSASITSSTPATLTMIGNGDYSYSGKVTGSATLEKKGTGTLTIIGANTGYLTVNDGTLILSGSNSEAKSITIGEKGTFVPTGVNSAATQINLEGGTLTSYDSTLLSSSTIDVKGDSTINIVGPESGTYSRQLLTGTAKDMTYFTAPEFISNMDLIANTAYASGAYAADIWGDKTKDQNNTNLLQTSIVNTTDSPITLDFAYQFHNSAYLAVIDSEGNRTVVMDWTNTASHTVDGGTYSYASNTGSYTFEPGETYTIEARIFRFNRTIGANGGGVNGFGGTLVGYGARVSGTDGEYLPLNFNGDNWTFSDGSFTFSNQVFFSAPVTINSEASLTFNVPNNDLAVSSAISGAGTLNVNPEEGFTHTYSGNIGGSLSLVKSSDGVLVLNHANDMSGTVNVQAGEVVYAQAGAMNFVSGLTIAQDAQMTVNLPASDGAAGVNGFVQNNGTITITKGRLRTFGITGNGAVVMDGGTLMNLGRTVNGNHAETIVDNAIVIEEGKTGTFNVGWALNSFSDSKLQLNGTLSGAGDFILQTNADAPSALSQIAPLIPNFSSSDFTGNVIVNSGYNMLKMGKENAFGKSVGTLQDNGWVDVNGYNQTFAGLTGTGNLINRGSVDATLTLNVPEGETSKFEGMIYGIANLSTGKSYANISLFKTGEGTAQFNVGENEVYIHDVIVNSGRIDFKEYFYGSIGVNDTATLSPGNSIGKLTIDGTVLDSEVDALILHTGSTLLMEVGGETPEENDMLIVLGDFTLEDGAVIQLVLADNNTLGTNGNFAVQITADGIDLDTIENALSYYQFSGVTVTQNGSTFTISGAVDPNAVPEPSTWALLALGVAGLLYWRKRK